MAKLEKSLAEPMGIIEKIISQKKTNFECIEDLNLEKMIENLNAETTEEENLRKILEFRKSDEKCLEEHLCSVFKKQPQ